MSTSLKWLARALFAAAVLAVGYGLWIRRSERLPPVEQPPPEKPVVIDWSKEPFRPWRSVEDGIELAYPARYDETRGFGRFTSRDLQDGLVESDLVAFRSMSPRSVIIVATYKAPRALSWQEWVALARRGAGERESGRAGESSQQSAVSSQPSGSGHSPQRVPAEGVGYPRSGWRAGGAERRTPNAERRMPGPPSVTPGPQPPTPFHAEFGGSNESYRVTKAGGRDALAVSARGALRFPMRGNERMELWQFESRLVAEGDTAVRVTAGMPVSQYAGARAGLERALDSFRWSPQGNRRASGS